MDDVRQDAEAALDPEQGLEDGGVTDEATQPFVGRWNQLVSSTNWEKGRIIAQWRAALVDGGVPPTSYSDDAWSRAVGGITAQHVGRLRRVWQRFGATHEKYSGLFWSHFQAALDWDDAEMWLEGAVQSGWSVSQMRRARWETMGAIATQEPVDSDIVVSETDEDFEPAVNVQPESHEDPSPNPKSERFNSAGAAGPLHEGPDFGDEASVTEPPEGGGDQGAAIFGDDSAEQTIAFIKPFANVGELPEDLAEAFELYKLAILRHKSEAWAEISREDVLASLESLKQLVDAPE